MSATNSIVIAFIRNVKNHKNDDHLLIKQSKHQNLFNIEYRDNFNNIRNKSVTTEGEVADMIENFLNLLPNDQDPFSHIQITAPAFPPVMLTVSSLTNYDVRESIHSVVRNTIRNWPSAEPLRTRPVTRSQTRDSVATVTA